MHPDLENLINMALADGEVTEKERAIILRKAESLGEDKDEVEMIMDGRIAMMKKEIQQSKPILPISKKEGDMRKCPSCGAIVESFQTKCTDCGMEFRNINVISTVQKLHEDLQKVEIEERNRPEKKDYSLKGLIGSADLKEETLKDIISNRKANVISSFPVPNSKEDILEFLSMALPECKRNSGFFSKIGMSSGERVLLKAWKSKCEQIIMKARFSMKEDKNTLEEINHYANQIDFK